MHIVYNAQDTGTHSSHMQLSHHFVETTKKTSTKARVCVCVQCARLSVSQDDETIHSVKKKKKTIMSTWWLKRFFFSSSIFKQFNYTLTFLKNKEKKKHRMWNSIFFFFRCWETHKCSRVVLYSFVRRQLRILNTPRRQRQPAPRIVAALFFLFFVLPVD